MAKQHISEDNIKLIVDVESAKAQQEIHKLEKANRALSAENKKRLEAMVQLESQGKKETEAYRNLQKVYKETSAKISDNTKKIAENTQKVGLNHLTMAQLRKEAKQLQRQLDNTSKVLNPEGYKKLANELTNVKSRMNELSITASGFKEKLTDKNVVGFFTGSMLVKGVELAVTSMAHFAGSIREAISASTELAMEADGVSRAFDALNRPDLLDNLRKATKGTVTDVELMKAAVQARDFRLPLEDLGKYLQFAQLKAQQTGQSVEFLTNSIVMGLGRQSKQILDNLGISAAEIDEKMKSCGSMAKAVSQIIDEQFAAAGKTYVSAADRAAQRTVALQNAQKELGDALLPVKEKFEDVYGDIQVKTLDAIKWMLQYKEVVLSLIVAFVAYSAAVLKVVAAEKLHTITTKAATVAHVAWNTVLTTGKGIYLLSIALWSKMTAAIATYRGATDLATAATVRGTAAMRLFNTTCKANVFLALATVVLTAATAIYTFAKRNKDATKATKELSAAEREEKQIRTESNAEMKRTIATLKNWKGSKKEELKQVKELNTKYGEAMGYYKSVKDWYKALVKNSQLYCDQMVIEAQIRKYANQAAEIEDKKESILKNPDGTTRRYSTRNKTISAIDDATGDEVNMEFKNTSDKAKAQRAYNKLAEEGTRIQSKMNVLVQKQLDIQKKMHTGLDKDPYANGDPKTTTSTGDKVGTEQKKTYDNSRQADLQKEEKRNKEQLTKYKEMLVNKEILQGEYDAKVLTEEILHAQKVMQIEQKYSEKSQALQIKNQTDKQKIVQEQQKYEEVATQNFNQKQLDARQKFANLMIQLEKEGMTPAEQLKNEQELQLKALESYYKAALVLAKQNGEDVAAVEAAYAKAKEKLIAEQEKKNSQQRMQVRSSYGLLTIEEEETAAIKKVEEDYRNGALQSETEYQQAKENVLREFEERRLQIRQEYGLATLDEQYDAELQKLQDHLDKKLLSEQEYAAAVEQLNKEKEQQMFSVREQYGLVSNRELFEKQQEELTLQYEQGKISYEDYLKAQKQMAVDYYKQMFDTYKSAFSDAVNALQQAEMDNIDAKYDAEIEAARNAGKDTTELENKKANEQLKVQKKWADVQFAIKASEIVADTAVGITKLWASPGYPMAIPLSALLAITGAAQLASANAERRKVKKLTLNGAGSSGSGSGARVATGRESGGYMDVEREQDGRHYKAKYEPRRRGFIDRPTVLVGEGPFGQSKEWVASNDAVSNPTIAPILNLLDHAQRMGNIRTIDFNKLMAKQIIGRSTGGSFYAERHTPMATPTSDARADMSVLDRLSDVLDRIEQNGIPASVSLSEIEQKQDLKNRSRRIASK